MKKLKNITLIENELQAMAGSPNLCASSVLPCVVTAICPVPEIVIFASVSVRSVVFQRGVIGSCGKGRTLPS